MISWWIVMDLVFREVFLFNSLSTTTSCLILRKWLNFFCSLYTAISGTPPYEPWLEQAKKITPGFWDYLMDSMPALDKDSFLSAPRIDETLWFFSLFLGGDFKYLLFSPQKFPKWSNLASILSKWVVQPPTSFDLFQKSLVLGSKLPLFPYNRG